MATKEKLIKKYEKRKSNLTAWNTAFNFELSYPAKEYFKSEKKIFSTFIKELKNLKEKTVERSELLRFSQLLYEKDLLRTNKKKDIKNLFEEFENLSNSAKRK